MFKLSALALSAILLGASATPVRRNACMPNAQGSPVSIQNAATGLEWAAPNDFNIVGESYASGLTSPRWHIPQSGEYPISYYIELVFSLLALHCRSY